MTTATVRNPSRDHFRENFFSAQRIGKFMHSPVKWIRTQDKYETLRKATAIFIAFILSATVIGLVIVIPGIIEWKRQVKILRPAKIFSKKAEGKDATPATDKVNEPKTVETQLKNLDSENSDLRAMAKLMMRSFPKNIPSFKLTKEEAEDAEMRVKHLENYLIMTYGKQFKSLVWHGEVSFRRIIWQDEQLLKSIRDPLMIKSILIRASKNLETKLPSNMTLSRLLLKGLGNIRLSYLVSASPNWSYMPPTVDRSYLHDMGITQVRPEIPRKITTSYLDDVQKLLNVFRTVLKPVLAAASPSKAESSVNKQINEASVSDLLRAFKELVDDDEKICYLTNVDKLYCTLPNRMAGQCYEVMMSYEELLKKEGGNHEAVIGYGLVSHALDAKHLAAAIYMSAHPESKYMKEIHERYGNKLDFGKTYLEALLDDASKGKLDAKASNLLKIRLQQIMDLAANNSKLKLSAKTIVNSLK